MSAKTGIQWTGSTWNYLIGCTRKSAGCDHCYAFELHDRRHVAWKRGRFPTAPAQYHLPFSRVQVMPARLTDPFHWPAPRRVFVNSLSDAWHQDVPDDVIAQMFGVMALTPRHTYQILTKRPERMSQWLAAFDGTACVTALSRTPQYQALMKTRTWRRNLDGARLARPWPLSNVHIGVSVENQETADERIPTLLAAPAAVRFLSMEPLLGPVDLGAIQYEDLVEIDALAGTHGVYRPHGGANARLDWVILGGESGRHARWMDPAWARLLIEQCRAAGVPVFMKQVGSVLAKQWDCQDAHGGDPAEWPEDLRVREYPAPADGAGGEVMA